MWVEGKYHERAEGCCVSQLNPIDTNIYHKYQRGFSNRKLSESIKWKLFPVVRRTREGDESGGKRDNKTVNAREGVLRSMTQWNMD